MGGVFCIKRASDGRRWLAGDTAAAVSSGEHGVVALAHNRAQKRSLQGAQGRREERGCGLEVLMWLTSPECREDGGGELGSDELFREPGGTGERETRGKTERGSRAFIGARMEGFFMALNVGNGAARMSAVQARDFRPREEDDDVS